MIDMPRSLEVPQHRAGRQTDWPFSYPFEDAGSFMDSTVTAATVQIVQGVGYRCAFAQELGVNLPGQDAFRIRRIDPKNLKTAACLR
jgi:hypothetical protein